METILVSGEMTVVIVVAVAGGVVTGVGCTRLNVTPEIRSATELVDRVTDTPSTEKRASCAGCVVVNPRCANAPLGSVFTVALDDKSNAPAEPVVVPEKIILYVPLPTFTILA